MPPEGNQFEYERITEKSCICVGLGTTALLANNLDTKTEGKGVSVCPGPNMAYFSRIMSLENITDHIYGRSDMISRTDRPNMFIKELNIYIDFMKKKMEESRFSVNTKQVKYLSTSIANLKEGIHYYRQLFNENRDQFEDSLSTIMTQLEEGMRKLHNMNVEVEKIALVCANK